MKKEQFIDKVSKRMFEGKCDLFIGSGVSRESQMPSWGELLQPLAEDIGITIEETDDLPMIAQYIVNENSNNKNIIYSRIRDCCDKGYALNRYHYVISDMNINIVWTTNYDDLLEKYLNEKDTYKVLFTSKNLDKLERNVSKSKRTEDRVLWLLVNQQIFFTKDKTFIADCIQKFFMEDVRYYHPDNMDLIEWHDKIRKDISALDEKKYPYFIFNATSVTDSVYNMFFRFNDDTLEDIPISLKEKDEDIVDFVYIENGKIKKLISNLEI